MARIESPFSFEFILLGFIHQKPNYGYDLYQQINHSEDISLIWHIKRSRYYALLDKLDKNGLIKSVTLPGDSYPDRKEFHITPKGEKEFTDWVSAPVEHGRDIRQIFLAKLFFIQKMGAGLLEKLVHAQKDICIQWLSDFNNTLVNLGDRQAFERMVYQYRISQINATIEWLDDLLAR